MISPANEIEHVRSPSVNEDDWEVLDQHIHEFTSPTDPDFKIIIDGQSDRKQICCCLAKMSKQLIIESVKREG